MDRGVISGKTDGITDTLEPSSLRLPVSCSLRVPTSRRIRELATNEDLLVWDFVIPSIAK